VHYAQGMKGVITVGSGRGSGPTTTAASAAGSNVALVTTPNAAVPPSAGKPAIYRAGWALFAVGALLALVLLALLRASPPASTPEALATGPKLSLVEVSLRGRRAGVKIGPGCPPTPVLSLGREPVG
jgi:hypothetical protein